MQYQVPQFIYRDPKIVGPLTFKQFIYVAGAGFICFILYFVLAKKSFLLFLFLSLVAVFTSLFLAFGQVGGRSIPTAFANFFSYTFSNKIYLWKKKETPLTIVMQKTPPEEKKEEKPEFSPMLKIAEKSRLRSLSTEIETKR
jgi:hypothetical protein